jgi:acyl-homoserine lactone acylase PvdQ
VELGAKPKAWSMVPGGTDGDPFSPAYTRDLREWSKGEMKPVNYWKTWSEAVANAGQVFQLEPQ